MLTYLLNLAVHLCIGKVYPLLLLIVENIVVILPNDKTIISIVSNIRCIMCFIKSSNLIVNLGLKGKTIYVIHRCRCCYTIFIVDFMLMILGGKLLCNMDMIWIRIFVSGKSKSSCQLGMNIVGKIWIFRVVIVRPLI